MHDLLSVLTGNAYTGSGPIRMFSNFSDGEIREEKYRIYLYLWFDARKPEPFKSDPIPPGASRGAVRASGIDPASIK